MGGTIIEVSPRTPWDWKAVPQATSTGDTTLIKAFPVLQYREVSLLIRIHVTTTGNAGSKITVKVMGTAPSDEDPTIIFGTASALATTDIATGTAAGTLVKLDISPQASTPVNAGAFLAITMKAVGPTSGAGDVTGTLSMAFVCK